MRDLYRAVVAVAFVALSATAYSIAQDNPAPPNAAPPNPAPPSQTESAPDNAAKPPAPSREPTVTVLDHREVQGILGKQVRSAADEDMGRVVDVIVDRGGQARAAIIDFGGFLGVGSRKIAVAWNALRFSPNADKVERIALELTRDQVRAAPEYKEDKPVVVLGASGSLESLPYP
jgi:PRC-barrel domain protein